MTVLTARSANENPASGSSPALFTNHTRGLIQKLAKVGWRVAHTRICLSVGSKNGGSVCTRTEKKRVNDFTRAASRVNHYVESRSIIYEQASYTGRWRRCLNASESNVNHLFSCGV